MLRTRAGQSTAAKKADHPSLGQVDFEAHELGPLGNIEKDLSTLSEVEELLSGLSNDEDRLSFAADLAGDGRLIEEHLRKQSGQ